MKTIEANVTTQLEIKKSKFITCLFPLKEKNEIKERLDKVKEDYPNATHYCYAYLFEQEKRCSDDGEPGKTAGYPILNVLEQQHLNNILCIIVRYFGGIKLGAGGLVRAYSNACQEGLKSANIQELEEGFLITFSIPYDRQKEIDYYLKKYSILQKNYTDQVNYQIEADKETLDYFKTINLPFQIIKKIKIKKS